MGWLSGIKKSVMGSPPPGVYLGAFGKHPGWNDHIEPVGLDSEGLLVARDILYVRGIGGVIDGALWDKRPDEVLPQIGHVFSWSGEGNTLIGRMWSSVDGKGRTKYPMVAIAHFEVPFSYTLVARAARVLAAVETRCREATTAEQVKAIFASELANLRAALAQPPDGLGPEPDRAACSRLAHEIGLDEGEIFARVLYSLEGKAQAFGSGTKSSGAVKINFKLLEEEMAAQSLRLPMYLQDSVDGIAFWHKVVRDFTRLKQPLMFIHPTDHPWVDLVIGKPTSRELYCIRANETALPPASAVPYELDAEFKQKAAEFIAKVCDLTPRPAASQAAAPRAMFAAETAAGGELPPPLPPM